MLNVINMGEIIYTVQRRFGLQYKLEVVMNIERLGIHILHLYYFDLFYYILLLFATTRKEQYQ